MLSNISTVELGIQEGVKELYRLYESEQIDGIQQTVNVRTI